MAYELRMALAGNGDLPQPMATPASFDEIELFVRHLEQSMINSGFLDPQEPKRLLQRMRRLFARARLEKEEVNILRGILSALGKQQQAQQEK
mgnify:FL=1